jgi:hypothetical protein
VAGGWAKFDADGTPTNSPYLYALAWHQRGGFITGFDRTVSRSELAAVRASYASEVDGSRGSTIQLNRLRWRGHTASLPISSEFTLPFARVEYHNDDPDTEWRTRFQSSTVADSRTLSWVDGSYQQYAAGRSYAKRWNYGVYGPAFPAQALKDSPYDSRYAATRTGDQISFRPAMLSDAPDHSNYLPAPGNVTVVRDGETVVDAPYTGASYTAPPAAADYQVTVAVSRSTPAVLATESTTTWTFRSGHVDGTAAQQLPVAAIRFAPLLDDHNTALAARGLFPVPISIQGQPGSDVGSCTSLSVEVSYDDGTSWTKVLVVGIGGERLALLRHPAGHGLVSLKAKATMTSGSTVEQTIQKAYKF